MYLSLISRIRSSLIHLHGFLLFVLLPQLTYQQLIMLIEQGNLSPLRNLALATFGKLLIVFLVIANLLPPLLTVLRSCLLNIRRVYLLIFFLRGSCIFLPAFLFGTNLKLHKKVISNLIPLRYLGRSLHINSFLSKLWFKFQVQLKQII